MDDVQVIVEKYLTKIGLISIDENDNIINRWTELNEVTALIANKN